MELSPLAGTGVLFAWGLLVKFLPALAAVPNKLIPYMNLTLAILMKVAGPEPAHASLFAPLAASCGWLFPLLQTIAAQLAYETFIRPGHELATKGTRS